MLTREQALTAKYFHEGECRRTIGPRGGVRDDVIEWRRNGTTATWRTRPGWRIPVKRGLYEYGQIYDRDAACYHVAGDCPLNDPSYVTHDERQGGKIRLSLT